MKKIISLCLALCMICALSVSAFAADIDTNGGFGSTPVNLSSTDDGTIGGDPSATAMSVTLPTALPMAMAQNGDVTTADNCQIVNNSYGAVRIMTEKDVDLIRINEAAPVIGDVAMETITETIITESTMIGHNPSTPGGLGTGTGITIDIRNIGQSKPGDAVIVIIPREVDFESSSQMINEAMSRGIHVNGAIVQRDDGVLINNRIKKVIPIVDEIGRASCRERV